jgi:hypothetical protein
MSKTNERVLGRILAQEQINLVGGATSAGSTDYSADSTASGESPFPTYASIEQPQTVPFADNRPQQER